MASKRLQAEVQRRDTAASLLQLALQEAAQLVVTLTQRGADAECMAQAGKVWDALLLVEERVGVVVPRSLFGEDQP